MATERKSSWLKWLITLIVLIGGGIGGLAYWANDHSEPPIYQTAPASRGELTQAVTANGQLNPVLNIQVGSQISGNIQHLYADFNSLVKSNQVVAQLDPATYQAVVQQTEADLSNAVAGFELQAVETKRTEALSKEKLVSDSEYDKAVATLHQAQATVKIKQAAMAKARVDLEHCTIYAPVDGIVISRNVDVGQTVAASMNAPTLFIIANDLTKMQIDANISEADVGTVEEGQDATFTVDAFPGRTFNGKVTQIRNSPVTVQNVVTYDTVIGVNNPDMKLKPGMTATVSVITAQKNGVLRIPNAALRFKPPEPSTNLNFAAKLLAKIGLGKASPTNTVQAPKLSGTNAGDTATGPAPLTGKETPEELMKKMRDYRERGEEPPPELRAKIGELFRSGALQGMGGGGRGMGGPGGGGGGGAPRPRPAQSAWHTIYVLAKAPAGKGDDAESVPQAIRIKTGISDGIYTEVTDGLKEGDQVITSARFPHSTAATAPPPGASPFGGGGGGGRRF